MKSHRMYGVFTWLMLISVLITTGAAPASTSHKTNRPVVLSDVAFAPGELLVRFKADVTSSTGQLTLEKYAMRTIRPLYNSDVHLLRVPEGRELEIAAALNADPGVVFAEPNYIYHAFNLIPNDPAYSNQWAHTLIRSPGAWSVTTGSSDIVIAVIDSGVDMTHPDLAGKLIGGRDFVDDDNLPSDENGHGTHVAGIAAAVTDNGVGVAGMSWGAKIMPLRALDNKGSGLNSDVTDAITWAYQNGADIINLSLGGPYYSQAMQDAINAAHAAGSLVVAAMGNCRTGGSGCPSTNPTQYPAAFNNVMAVAATDNGDYYAYYSQYGSHCDIAAPGGELNKYHDPGGIYSTLPTYAVYLTTYYGYQNHYDYLQGTSQATPHVSGLAALIWSMNPALTPDAVQDLIEQTADDVGLTGKDPDYGWGRINAQRALATLKPPAAPTLNAIANPDGDHTYTVTWSTVADAASYQLQEASTTGFNAPIIRYNGPNTQVLVTGREVGVWYYRVRAVNEAGIAGEWSNVQSVTVLPAAPVMTPIANSTNADAYTVQWTVVSGAYSYELTQDITSTFIISPTTRYIGSSTAYNVTGQPGGTWYYRVRALHGGLVGPWSEPVSTTVAPAPLSPPILTVLSDDRDGNYALQWSEVSGATVYTLEESLNPYFVNPLAVYIGAQSSYIVTEQRGGQWHYRVRAGGPAGRSPWSTPRTVIVTSYIRLPLVLKNYTPPISMTEIPNGDFESGLTHWSTYSVRGRVVIANTFTGTVTAHSGIWAAWLGGVNNEHAYIQRQLAIPAGTPYLRYWYWIDSTDSCGFDFGKVYINNALLKTYNLCSPYKTNGWITDTLDLRAYSNLTVTLSISATTDTSLISSLFIDDLIFKSAP